MALQAVTGGSAVPGPRAVTVEGAPCSQRLGEHLRERQERKHTSSYPCNIVAGEVLNDTHHSIGLQLNASVIQ